MDDREQLREHIALKLYNRFHAPASSVENMKGWAPSFLSLASELIAMVEERPARTVPFCEPCAMGYSCPAHDPRPGMEGATCPQLVYVGGSDYVEPCGKDLPCVEHAAQYSTEEEKTHG